MDSDLAPVPFGTLTPAERRTLIGCFFAGGCICLMPGEFAGTILCFLIAGGLGVWHVRRSRREREAAQARSTVPTEPGTRTS